MQREQAQQTFNKFATVAGDLSPFANISSNVSGAQSFADHRARELGGVLDTLTAEKRDALSPAESGLVNAKPDAATVSGLSSALADVRGDADLDDVDRDRLVNALIAIGAV